MSDKDPVMVDLERYLDTLEEVTNPAMTERAEY
jgi:hypothetical protein